MQAQGTSRRGYGTGSLHQYRGAWYGKWRIHGRHVKRKVGPVRKPGTRDGLTKKQAEARLRKLMGEAAPPPLAEHVTARMAGESLIAELEARGRKPSTVQGYRSYLNVHLVPEFGNRPLDRIQKRDVEAFIQRRRQGRLPVPKQTGRRHAGRPVRAKQSIKSIHNYVGFLHAIFEHAIAEGWATDNPCRHARVPEPDRKDADIHYLDSGELEALLVAKPGERATTSARLWALDRTLYLTAAMTGLRQGELIALRWMDIDWSAQRIRVRRNYVRGEFGTPKSKRSTRSVPMANRVAGELHRLYVGSAYQADDDLVFGHPDTGEPLDKSNLLKRYHRALTRAGLRRLRFHDLRHTFGTRMAGAGVPMRTLQEWMGHRDFRTTLVYADYAPSSHEAALVEAAFGSAGDVGIDVGISEAVG